MLSTISNSEKKKKKKVPDIRVIVTLLLLISHRKFFHSSYLFGEIRRIILDHTDSNFFLVCILTLFWTWYSECEHYEANFTSLLYESRLCYECN